MNSEGNNQELIVNALSKAITALQRMFYVNLFISGAILYLLYEAILLPITDEQIRATRKSLETLDRVVLISDYLKGHPEIIGAYMDFLSPYMEFEGNVKFKFASLDKKKLTQIPNGRKARDLLLAQVDNIEQIGNNISFEWYFSKDMRKGLPLYIVNFAEQFVVPEIIFDSQKALDRLVLISGVAGMLKLGIDVPKEFPSSFYFIDFSRKQGYSRMVTLLTEARLGGAIDKAYEQISQFCEASGLDTCVLSTVEAVISGKSIPKPVKIKIQYLPFGIERNMLFMFSAPLLLFTFHLYFGQFMRYLRTRSSFRENAQQGDVMLLEEGWALNNAVLIYKNARHRWKDMQVMIIVFFVALGHLAPVLAQAGLFIFFAVSLEANFTSISWTIAAFICLIGNISVLVRLFKFKEIFE